MIAALLQCRQASGTGLHWIAESAIRAIDGVVEGAPDRRDAVATASRWRVRRGRTASPTTLSQMLRQGGGLPRALAMAPDARADRYHRGM